jgi:hypothetical protein
VLIITVFQHCVQKQGKSCGSVTTLQQTKGTTIRIKQSLNSTGSTVGIAWVTICWGVMVCSQGWPCRWR